MSREILQPGPPAGVRVAAVPVVTTAIDTVLPAGTGLLAALAGLLAGPIESACLTIRSGALFPFGYVIPSLPPDPSHAAYYSDTRRPPGRCTLQTGAITLGWRDGEPFFHIHALWTEPDGRRGCGHVLPGETVIAEPLHVAGVGLTGARFEVHPDPETGFSLFTPVATGTQGVAGNGSAGRGIALRLAPNQDLTGTLEAIARGAGYGTATIHGGVASIIEARFSDAAPIRHYATEMAVHGAVIQGSSSERATALDVVIVDYTGDIRTGRLVNGDNPVLMTFEGVLAPAV